MSGAAVTSRRPSGWWGMALLIATELALFSVVLVGSLYLRFRDDGPWPPAGIDDPSLTLAIPMTVLILGAGGAMLLAARRAGRGRAAAVFLTGALALVVGFLVLQGFELEHSAELLDPQASAYSSLFFAIEGLHAAHLVIGLLLVAWALLAVLSARFTSPATVVSPVALYMQFMVVMWLAVLLVVYLSPRL